jgi:hypothetical protein
MDTGVQPARADEDYPGRCNSCHGDAERQPDWEWLHFMIVHAQARQTIEGKTICRTSQGAC